MNIDYYKIVTNDFKELISDEEYNELKKMGLKERNYYLLTCRQLKLKQYIVTKANEIIKSHRYENMNNVQKAIIAANIAYDDNKFCDALKAGNFSANLLRNYLKILNYLRIKTITHKLTKEDEVYQEKANIITRKLYSQLVKYNGVTDINIIINKISEIFSYYPELLETKANVRSK